MTINDSIIKFVADNHSVMLRDDGRLLVWGDNTYGQLGLGSAAPTTVYEPAELVFFKDMGAVISDIAVCEDATFVLLSNGKLYSFGKGLNGRLGLGSTANANIPTLIDGSQTRRFEKLYCGKEFIIATTSNNELYGWGRNNYGQVGVGTKVDVLMPTLVMSNADIKHLKVGADFVLLIKQDNSAYVWGNNDGGRYGFDTGTIAPSSTALSMSACTNPATAKCQTYAGSYIHTFGTCAGKWTTYAAYTGIKGNNQSITVKEFTSPQKVVTAANKAFSSISTLASTWNPVGTADGVTNTTTYKFKSTAVHTHTHTRSNCTNSTCNSLSADVKPSYLPWSANGTATGTATWQYVLPNAYAYFDTGKLTDLQLGSRHGITTINGIHYGWGDNSLKQQGTSGNANGYMVPLTQINEYIKALESGDGFSSLIVAGDTNYIISGNGNVSVWGSNANGKAGTGSTASYIDTPAKINALIGKAVAAIIAGRGHTFAVTHTGDVYAFGDNLYGQTGIGAEQKNNAKIATPLLIDASLFNRTPPEISGEDGELGDLTATGIIYTCTVTHIRDEYISVVASVNGKTLQTVSVANGAEYVFELVGDGWLKILNGANQKLVITATDSYGETAERVLTFAKNQTEIEFTLSQPKESPEKPYRMVLSLSAQIPPAGCEVLIEACNNAFDPVPTWEDITALTMNRRAHVFENTVCKAEKWGVDLRVSIKREHAPGDCYVSGFTYAFETESGSVQAMSAKLETNEQLMDVLLTEIIPGMIGGESV